MIYVILLSNNFLVLGVNNILLVIEENLIIFPHKQGRIKWYWKITFYTMLVKIPSFSKPLWKL